MSNGDIGGNTSEQNIPPATDDVFSDFLPTGDGQAIFDFIQESVPAIAAKMAEAKVGQNLDGMGKTVAFLIAVAWDLLKGLAGTDKALVEDALKVFVGYVTDVLLQVASPLGAVSQAYVAKISDALSGNEPAQARWSEVAKNLGADAMFDDILAPMAGLVGQKDPDQSGGGTENIQRTLGGIVSIHLMSWFVNIVSNLSGLGTLKFFNSFNEVMLSGLNARALGRLAMKPFIDTYMVTPTTNDLNEKWPLKPLSESAIIKAWMRGALTEDQARADLRKYGYNDNLSTQFLADSVKYLAATDVAMLVNLGWWTSDEAISYLQQAGWPNTTSDVTLKFERLRRVFSIMQNVAERLEAQLLAGQISVDDFSSMLHTMGFADVEIEWLNIKAQTANTKTKRFSEIQLRELYVNNLVDLNFVADHLEQLGWTTDDANLLILLDFAKKEDRDELRRVLGARARLLSDKLLNDSAIAINRGETAIAAAQKKLAEKEAALAKSLGG